MDGEYKSAYFYSKLKAGPMMKAGFLLSNEPTPTIFWLILPKLDLASSGPVPMISKDDTLSIDLSAGLISCSPSSYF
jgi:hypothetical protein